MAEPERLSRAFVELADTLVRDFDIVEFLTVLANRSCELLHATEAGVILADESGILRPVAASHETARMLELFELQNREGPCLECYREKRSIVNVSLVDALDRWPFFAREAKDAGFEMIHAIPMRLRNQVIGAVNVFDVATTPLTPSEIDVGQALADVATVGLLQERSIREARVLNEQLQGALESRILVEQAKGMLAERLTVDMDKAFMHLRGHARRTNTRLSDVCQAVLAGRLGAEAFLGDA